MLFSHSRISSRLFIQAACTALFAPTAAHGRGWLMITLVIAAAAVGVALVVRTNPPNLRLLVVGFEAAALGVGLVGMAEGHYIPGTIVGVVTMVTVLSGQQQVAPANTWAPPSAPYAAAPGWAPPPPPPPGESPVPPEPTPLSAVDQLPPVPRSMNILPGQ